MKEIFTRFPRLYNRLRRVDASTFARAGYPMAVPSDLTRWPEIHAWCAATFRDSKGVTYCWTGEKFWFQNENDRRKFVERFCRPGAGAGPSQTERPAAR